MRDNAILIATSDKYSKPHTTRLELPTELTSGAGDDIRFFTA